MQNDNESSRPGEKEDGEGGESERKIRALLRRRRRRRRSISRNSPLCRSPRKLVGMSEAHEIARGIVPLARNASLNIARTRDYFGVRRRRRREFSQLQFLHPSVVSDIERMRGF